jgi:hypothetical protein
MTPRSAGDDVDALYGVAPADFIRARNALAAKFREGGRRSDAAAVSKLRRPTPVLWAVNQVAREERGAVAALVQAAERLKGRRLIQPQDARAALDMQRTALARVAGHARQRLKRIGVQATPAIERRVSGTLLGALSDAEARDRLRAGRLTAELEAPGFEVLGGSVVRLVPARPGPPPRGRITQQTDRSVAEGEASAAAARARMTELNRQADQLEQDAVEQQRRAEEASATAAHFRRRATDATVEAGKARRAARAMLAAARKARQTAARARRR